MNQDRSWVWSGQSPPFFVMRRRREGEKEEGWKEGGKKGEKLIDVKVIRLSRDQNPERCTSHKVFPNRGTVYTPEADGIKKLQHCLLPNWIATCNGRKPLLRTEISGSRRRRRPTRQAGDKQDCWNGHSDSPESKSCLALLHPGRGEACSAATCACKYYYSFGH